jgi:charged multivesicular body protein 3
MNELVRVPQLQKLMQTMSAELMKAGIIEEMIDDALNLDDEELEQVLSTTPH